MKASYCCLTMKRVLDSVCSFMKDTHSQYTFDNWGTLLFSPHVLCCRGTAAKICSASHSIFESSTDAINCVRLANSWEYACMNIPEQINLVSQSSWMTQRCQRYITKWKFKCSNTITKETVLLDLALSWVYIWKELSMNGLLFCSVWLHENLFGFILLHLFE